MRDPAQSVKICKVTHFSKFCKRISDYVWDITEIAQRFIHSLRSVEMTD